MPKSLLLLLIVICTASIVKGQKHKVIREFHIASSGGWDYIAVNKGKVYVSHGNQVNILDEKSGDSIGVVLNTSGVHGIAFCENKGYTSNGRGNNVTVFDLATNKELDHIVTGENPDAIYYDPFSKAILTCNGKSQDLTVIDVQKNKVIATVPLGGKPEECVSDNKGHIYVNLADKSEIVVIGTRNWKQEHTWSLSPGEEPTGLKIDSKAMRLFSTCNKQLIVMDAGNGKVVAHVPIGDGCDGVVFDQKRKLIFTSNGEGNITVVQEKSPNAYAIVETITTKPRARTIAMDEQTHTMFLPTAEFEKPDPANPKARTKMLIGSFEVLVVQ